VMTGAASDAAWIGAELGRSLKRDAPAEIFLP